MSDKMHFVDNMYFVDRIDFLKTKFIFVHLRNITTRWQHLWHIL